MNTVGPIDEQNPAFANAVDFTAKAGFLCLTASFVVAAPGYHPFFAVALPIFFPKETPIVWYDLRKLPITVAAAIFAPTYLCVMACVMRIVYAIFQRLRQDVGNFAGYVFFGTYTLASVIVSTVITDYVLSCLGCTLIKTVLAEDVSQYLRTRPPMTSTEAGFFWVIEKTIVTIFYGTLLIAAKTAADILLDPRRAEQELGQQPRWEQRHIVHP